ncbi:SAM-dependent DNA methyltransferase [Egibacter rhizosphaerae]|uniref:site-specific DNA-methyltransferase (adenine-specific) n=1 Tax=Egibacter rhizosphaerae TaxID=1670831 RepID=A0A411YET8_9ACTN|nr:N-6 DNA methylase [Egibacter rhizosphaerae]QBI19719.1 SAM-dependent DNA methyltransferase [Egibacter rhizosphaerae]
MSATSPPQAPLDAALDGVEHIARTCDAPSDRVVGAVLGAVVERQAGQDCAAALGFPSGPVGLHGSTLERVARDIDAGLLGTALDTDPATLIAGPLGELHTLLLEGPDRAAPSTSARDGARRAAGAWYTPAGLVDAVLERTLEPFLSTPGTSVGGSPAGAPVRVLDPACGSGRFLLAAARRLREHGGAASLHGIERDPTAAALARAALWLDREDRPGPADVADLVTVGDALGDEITAAPADAVIGNPPHGGALAPASRRWLARRYPPARRAGNTAAAFLVRAHELTRSGGRVGFVLPKSLTYAHTWAPLRDWLEPSVVDVLDVTRAWTNVRLEQVVLVTRPDGRPGETVSLGRLGRPRRAVPAAIVRRIGTLPTGVDADDERLLAHLARRADLPLGELVRTVRGAGSQAWALEPGAPSSTGDATAPHGPHPQGGRHLPPQPAAGTEPLVAGRDLAPLRPTAPTRRLDLAACPPDRVRRADPPQAAFQNIVAHRTRPSDHACLIGTVLTEPWPCLDTVNLLLPRTGTLPPWGLAGLLLSHLASWFVHVAAYNRAIRTMHFDNVVLARIPLPDPDLPARLDPIARAIAGDPDDPGGWEALEDAVAAAWRLPTAARERLAATHAPRA